MSLRLCAAFIGILFFSFDSMQASYGMRFRFSRSWSKVFLIPGMRPRYLDRQLSPSVIKVIEKTKQARCNMRDILKKAVASRTK